MEEYQIALPPNLGLSPADFVTTWNETAECRTVAEAHLSSSHATHYDPGLIAGTIALLSTVGIGVVTNAVYDLLKKALTKKETHTHKHTEIKQFDQPDGTHLLVVVIDED